MDDATADNRSPEEEAAPARPDRRRFLRRAALGGASLLGAGAVGGHVSVAAERRGDADGGPQVTIGAGGGPSGPIAYARDGDAGGGYGHGFEPPAALREGTRDALLRPPPAEPAAAGRVRGLEIEVTEQAAELADGVTYETWAYNGTVPGPIIRATEGDLVRVRFHNRTGRPHNLHFHGRHAVAMDGWEPVAPGGATTYEIRAEPYGVHPYHCHVMPLAMHVARGMYGVFIVDPPGGRPPAHEVVLVLSGFDLDGDGRNELYGWNGIAGLYDRFPITVPVGEPVRAYVLNMTEYEPVGSFHLHAQTFDATWQGTSTEPDVHADTITLGQADRAIVEFTLPERGRYMFHPHQHHMADRGAMGWFAAV